MEDQFKQKDARAALARKYEAEIAAVNQSSRYRVINTSFEYGPYSDKLPGFSFRNLDSNLTFNPGRTGVNYSYSITNTKEIHHLKVPDETLARKIESLRASGSSDISLKYWIYFQGVNTATKQLKAQVTRLDVLGKNDELLLSIRPPT